MLFERSRRAKYLNISVKPFKGVRVAVPQGVSFTIAEHTVHSKVHWIQKHIARIKRLEKNYILVSNDNIEIDRKKAREILIGRLDFLAEKFGYSYNRVFIRNQKTRWGSCSTKNNINLNIRLLLLPEELMDFVILHELIHTKFKNHGKEFWEELLQKEPHAGILDDQINRYNIGL